MNHLFTYRLPALQQTAPLGVLLLLASALAVILALVILAEMVVLQLLNWGDLRTSARAALLANLASCPVALAALWLAPRFGLGGLLLGLVLSITIEGSVLHALRRGTPGHNWLVAVASNLASWLVIIIPIYWMR